jgi:dGTPase
LVHGVLGKPSGFEGNAQSFRTITKLSVRKRDPALRGLNLTRATLNGVLKYPWMRESAGKKSHKWGAYHTEAADFAFARDGCSADRRSVEAEMMDFADDVAYSTHDVEDYYRAGMLPLDRLFNDEREKARFLEASIKKWSETDSKIDRQLYEKTFDEMVRAFPFIGDGFAEPYNGSRRQRGAIRTLASSLIRQFFCGIKLNDPGETPRPYVDIDGKTKREIKILKELIWYYVIPNRSLAIQEEGQRRIIRELFQSFVTGDGHNKDHKKTLRIRDDLLGRRYCEQLEDLESDSDLSEEDREEERVRVVVDVIAEMSEFQAVQAHARLSGYAPNSFLDCLQR